MKQLVYIAGFIILIVIAQRVMAKIKDTPDDGEGLDENEK
jgi:hypothetical protein